MVTGPGFSSRNQPDQERTTAYRDSSGPNSRRDAHCATIVGNWKEPSGESRVNTVVFGTSTDHAILYSTSRPTVPICTHGRLRRTFLAIAHIWTDVSLVRKAHFKRAAIHAAEVLIYRYDTFGAVGTIVDGQPHCATISPSRGKYLWDGMVHFRSVGARFCGIVIALSISSFDMARAFEPDPISLESLSVTPELPVLSHVVMRPTGRMDSFMRISGTASGADFHILISGFTLVENTAQGHVVRREFVEEISGLVIGGGKRIEESFQFAPEEFITITQNSNGKIQTIDFSPVMFGVGDQNVEQTEAGELILYLAYSAILNNLTTIIPRRVQLGTPFYPRNVEELIVTMRDEFLPALRHGSAFSQLKQKGYASQDIEDAIQAAINSFVESNYSSDVVVRGATSHRGAEFIYAAGPLTIGIDYFGTRFDGNGDVVVLLDPFTGMVRLLDSEMRGEILLPDGGAVHINMHIRTEYLTEQLVPTQTVSTSDRILSIARDIVYENIVLIRENSVSETTPEGEGTFHLAFLMSPRLLITSTSSVKEQFVVVVDWWVDEDDNTSSFATLFAPVKLDDQLTYALNIVAGVDWSDDINVDMALELPSPGTKIFIIGFDGYQAQTFPGSVVMIREIEGESWIEVDIPTDELDIGGPLVNMSGEIVGVILPPDKTVEMGNMSTLVLSSRAIIERLGSIWTPRPTDAELAAEHEALTDGSICRVALASRRGAALWDDRVATRYSVAEAKRRGLTPEECTALLE